MTRFNQILPFCLLALCLAQDSGLYVNRIKIQTFTNTLNLNKAFTYYVADSYDQSQLDNFKNDAGSIGNLFEDDYAADTATCTNTECPKLRRLYAYPNSGNGTRIIDSALKASMGATNAKPIGFVAPYPGYCSSDDKVPIIEMYSDELKQYAYWSPAQPNQLVNLAATTVEVSRYNPVRLVGYALSADSERLVLENAQPDYIKSISKANYTHSFFPARQLIQFTNANGIFNIPTVSVINEYSAKTGFTLKNTGLFILGKDTAAQVQKLEAKCGARYQVFLQEANDKSHMSLTPMGAQSGYKSIALAGWTFKQDKAGCGGIKGLGKIRELKHKTKAGYFTYENVEANVNALKATGEWEQTAKDLGYATLDQIGFYLINLTI